MRSPIPFMLATAALLVTAPPASATFPGDNGLLVFQAETENGMQLFTMKPDGTDTRQVTDVEPVPPPDPFLQSPGASRPGWSPDGSTIVFAENDCTIAFIAADGSDLRRVEPEPGISGSAICEGAPAFTPDARAILYERCEGISCEFWAADVDGTNRRRITGSCSPAAAVSPDGTRIATKGCTGLWVANIDGTDARQVTPDLDIAKKFTWAPDGSAIAFSDDSDDSSPEAINIATVAPDGSGLRYLTDVEPGSHAYVGSYSPDGTSIVYRLDRGGESALFVMTSDGRDVRQITDFSAFRPRYVDWGAAPIE